MVGLYMQTLQEGGLLHADPPRAEAEKFTGEPGGLLSMGSHRVGHD